MYIKLKNKSEIYVLSAVHVSKNTCRWCGKEIKAEKKASFSANGPYAVSGWFCSAAHLKAASNARL